MMLRVAWGVFACSMLPICFGCSSNTGTIRAQNPSDMSSPHLLTQNVPTQVGPAYYNGPAGYGPPVMQQSLSSQQMMLPSSSAGAPMCPNGCPECISGGGLDGRRGWSPHHNRSITLKQPKNLVYPPQNQPAAVVQYPYYTIKGPTDFFWTE